MKMRRLTNSVLIMVVLVSAVLCCSFSTMARIIIDQLDREVEVPDNIERVAALHFFSAKIMYSLGLEDKLVHKAIFGEEGKALAKVSPEFAALPELVNHRIVNLEELIGLNPQVVFVYASFSREDIDKFEDAGLTVVACKGETMEEALEAVQLLGEIFQCQERASGYTRYIQGQLAYIAERVAKIPRNQRPKVLVTGPNSIYTVATGEMLQSVMVEAVGGINVASGLKGFWAEVSPEQIVVWNPDYILMGSSFGPGMDVEIYRNPAFQTVNAVRNKKVFVVPSNIGWWDFPLPHATIGMLWMAKTIQPVVFSDIDMLATANEFYRRSLGFTFTELGGKLD